MIVEALLEIMLPEEEGEDEKDTKGEEGNNI